MAVDNRQLELSRGCQDKGRPPQDDAPYNSRCAGCGINASRTRILLDRLIVRKRKYYAQEEWVPSGSLCHVARRQPASQQRRRRQSNTHDYLRPVYPTAETTNRNSRTVSVIGKLCGFQSGNGNRRRQRPRSDLLATGEQSIDAKDRRQERVGKRSSGEAWS